MFLFSQCLLSFILLFPLFIFSTDWQPTSSPFNTPCMSACFRLTSIKVNWQTIWVFLKLSSSMHFPEQWIAFLFYPKSGYDDWILNEWLGKVQLNDFTEWLYKVVLPQTWFIHIGWASILILVFLLLWRLFRGHLSLLLWWSLKTKWTKF